LTVTIDPFWNSYNTLDGTGGIGPRLEVEILLGSIDCSVIQGRGQSVSVNVESLVRRGILLLHVLDM
jgi:hypothetical protein